MNLQDISPDQVVYWQWGVVKISATLAYTWLVMALLVLLALLAARSLRDDDRMSRLQNLLEIVVSGIQQQIREISHQEPGLYLPFVGTLFLFILVSNLLAVVPGYVPPTASLSTTAALAACVFASVFLYGIRKRGLRGYFAQYLQPTPFMLPFNVIGEFSRTLALAVRLFGNMMSGAKIGAILLAITPLIFPVVMNVLGLLTGVIQAYIFGALAMVYIASATRVQEERAQKNAEQHGGHPEQQGESHG